MAQLNLTPRELNILSAGAFYSSGMPDIDWDKFAKHMKIQHVKNAKTAFKNVFDKVKAQHVATNDAGDAKTGGIVVKASKTASNKSIAENAVEQSVDQKRTSNNKTAAKETDEVEALPFKRVLRIRSATTELSDTPATKRACVKSAADEADDSTSEYPEVVTKSNKTKKSNTTKSTAKKTQDNIDQAPRRSLRTRSATSTLDQEAAEEPVGPVLAKPANVTDVDAPKRSLRTRSAASAADQDIPEEPASAQAADEDTVYCPKLSKRAAAKKTAVKKAPVKKAPVKKGVGKSGVKSAAEGLTNEKGKKASAASTASTNAPNSVDKVDEAQIDENIDHALARVEANIDPALLNAIAESSAGPINTSQAGLYPANEVSEYSEVGILSAPSNVSNENVVAAQLRGISIDEWMAWRAANNYEGFEDYGVSPPGAYVECPPTPGRYSPNA